MNFSFTFPQKDLQRKIRVQNERQFLDVENNERVTEKEI